MGTGRVDGHGAPGRHGGQITGEEGEPTFRWDGVERQPDIVRWQEYIYLREDETLGDSPFPLEFVCNMGGNILFPDWGAVLLWDEKNFRQVKQKHRRKT